MLGLVWRRVARRDSELLSFEEVGASYLEGGHRKNPGCRAVYRKKPKYSIDHCRQNLGIEKKLR